MSSFKIPYQSTGYFSKLICDYVAQNDSVKNLYGNFPDIKGFEQQIQLKKENFSSETRAVLTASLHSQYKKINISEKTSKNLQSLHSESTFTIVTGHQLNIFTGPLYFLYKIVSVINLTKELKEKFPENNYVPVYWMATEDHDFEEINHFFLENKKMTWGVESSGAVGKKQTVGLEEFSKEFSNLIGGSENANYLKNLFEKSYVEHDTLAAATRFLVNELFGSYGLVIIDGDDYALKKEFSPYVENELINQYAHKSIADVNTFLEKNYKVQVNPREINLFYMQDQLRERIVFEKGLYKINNTDIIFTQQEILKELREYPENFSPNVIMRPLFQEVVLPNLCYVGGGGEIAYWLQLKNLFLESKISLPILLVRNSVLLVSEKQETKLNKLNLTFQELFLEQQELINKKVQDFSELSLNFSGQKKELQKIFDELKFLAEKTDFTFKGALEAQEKKQTKGLNNLEKRLLKAERKKYSAMLDRIEVLQDQLFPRKGLQERNVNFSSFYVDYGESIIPILLKELKPLEFSFTIIRL